MATKREIIYNILNIITGGRVDDDLTPSYRQLGFIFDYKRAQYMRQDQTKNWFDIDTIYQDLGCLAMEEVDSSECCHFETGCTIYRTVKTIPEVLRFNYRYALKVSAIDKRKRFEIVSPERFDFIGYTRYPRLTEAVYYLNNRLYTRDIAALNVRAALVKPDDAKTFVCGDKQCYTDSDIYPMPSDMITLITNDILNTELKILFNLGQDLENDAIQNNKPIITG